MTAAMSLDGVCLHHGRTTILSGVSLDVRAGEVVALVGPSGAGKTSVLRALLGLSIPQRGAVLIGGAPATRDGRLLRPPEARRLAVIFQGLALWPHMTVEGNLAFGLAAQGVPAADARRRIAAMLERVGLGGLSSRRPGELSGGEQQRVAIARALVLEPEGMLFDEPLANLDVITRRQLVTMFRDLLGERRTAAIYVTHDPEEAIALADRVAVMERGAVVQSGTARELAASPATDFVRAFAEAMLERPDVR